ncbi:hypothetical protein N665_0003s0021 [Sinapis alba]|nr:hypothetical protein N665_0003s0021 [Sinapis alba]
MATATTMGQTTCHTMPTLVAQPGDIFTPTTVAEAGSNVTPTTIAEAGRNIVPATFAQPGNNITSTIVAEAGSSVIPATFPQPGNNITSTTVAEAGSNAIQATFAQPGNNITPTTPGGSVAKTTSRQQVSQPTNDEINRAISAAASFSTRHPGTEIAHSNLQDISLIFKALVGKIDELARGTSTRFDDLAQSQIMCNNRINELQSVERDASRSRQINVTPQLQRVLFNEFSTPVTEPRQQQRNNIFMPTSGFRQQGRNQPNDLLASLDEPRYQRQIQLSDQHTHAANYPQTINREAQHKDEEIEEMKVQLQYMTSKVHQATSSAPKIDCVLRKTQNTPFAPRLLSILV